MITESVEAVNLLLASPHTDATDHLRPLGLGKGESFFQGLFHAPSTRLWQAGAGEFAALGGLTCEL